MEGAEIDALVAHGLDRYRAGDIDGALVAWERALAVDPEEPRALGYVDYVRQNYDELAGGSTAPLAEMLIPFGLARSDDDDEYEISITLGDDAGDDVTATRHRVGGDVPSAPEPSIDDGWGLDAESEPTWFTGPAKAALGFATDAAADLDPALPGGSGAGGGWLELEGDAPSGERAASEGGFGDEERTSDFRQAMPWPPPPPLPADVMPPAPVSAPGSDADASELSGESTAEINRNEFGSEFTSERTTERSTAKLAPEVLQGLGLKPVNERRAGSEDLTIEAWPHAGGLDLAAPSVGAAPAGPPPVEEPFVEALPPPEQFEDQGTADLKGKVRVLAEREDARQRVEVEELVLPPPRSSLATIDDDGDSVDGQPNLSADEDMAARLSAEIDEDAPPRENHEERVRRRIAALLERAQRAADEGQHPIAVAAIDLALSEAPDVAAAQKLVHRSRDLILDCYYRYFGNLERIPALAAPLSELTRRPLDPRAAFLLSRIDGTLTFEEILDVAGMGRLEACRHLAHLLWRGIIRTP
jgi:hypothetical protein